MSEGVASISGSWTEWIFTNKKIGVHSTSAHGILGWVDRMSGLLRNVANISEKSVSAVQNTITWNTHVLGHDKHLINQQATISTIKPDYNGPPIFCLRCTSDCLSISWCHLSACTTVHLLLTFPECFPSSMARIRGVCHLMWPKYFTCHFFIYSISSLFILNL